MTTKSQKECTTCHVESWSKNEYTESKSQIYSSASIREITSTMSTVNASLKLYHSVQFSRGADNNVSVSYNSKSAEKKKLISELNKKFGQ